MSGQGSQNSPIMQAATGPLLEGPVIPTATTAALAQMGTSDLMDSAPTGQNEEFLELRRRIRQAGLLEKQPLYYTMKIVTGVGLLAIGVAVMVTLDSLWIQLINAVFVGFAFSQVSFIGHDAGHYQIARTPRRNELAGLLATFLIAMDLSWWIDKHNKHHANPNVLEEDADIEVSVLAFTEEQALSKNIILRQIVRYQAFLFYPILMLSSISLRFGGVAYMVKGGAVKYQMLEPLLILGHAVIYLWMLYYFLGPLQGALFLLVHQAVAGLLMGGTFAPNHKGMPVIDRDAIPDFMRLQVLTSRNVKAHPITDVVYGGLNYQIEHHLFPSMARNNLGKAQKIVKAFCAEKSIPYHETSVIGSNVEIVRHLHLVSRVLRARRVTN